MAAQVRCSAPKKKRGAPPRQRLRASSTDLELHAGSPRQFAEESPLWTASVLPVELRLRVALSHLELRRFTRVSADQGGSIRTGVRGTLALGDRLTAAIRSSRKCPDRRTPVQAVRPLLRERTCARRASQ
jgi:hypothetical protein